MAMQDTPPDVAERHRAIARALSPAERLERGARMCASARRFMRVGIRMRHPSYTADDVELALLRLLLADDDLFRAAKPSAPLLAP
jgi:hypothetical protein